ncbi:GNAT family N-acetyltransferase [Vibrio vulnificus]|uniref:GNAT family N-acetyltransferase n=1 Tax=Vibrio vulnificus TaxID=672 RepID=UPI004058B2E3
MFYKEREATVDDYEFLFELKKLAEFDAIKSVFGWDESLQWKLHLAEWNEAKPTIIEIDGKRAGSYLLQNKGGSLYFGRFFLLPEFHGKGIGSSILKQCIAIASKENKRIELCYLQGSRVANLYGRHGFSVTSENENLVFMERLASCS